MGIPDLVRIAAPPVIVAIAYRLLAHRFPAKAQVPQAAGTDRPLSAAAYHAIHLAWVAAVLLSGGLIAWALHRLNLVVATANRDCTVGCFGAHPILWAVPGLLSAFLFYGVLLEPALRRLVPAFASYVNQADTQIVRRTGIDWARLARPIRISSGLVVAAFAILGLRYRLNFGAAGMERVGWWPPVMESHLYATLRQIELAEGIRAGDRAAAHRVLVLTWASPDGSSTLTLQGQPFYIDDDRLVRLPEDLAKASGIPLHRGSLPRGP